jgi:hypothetical protein
MDSDISAGLSFPSKPLKEHFFNPLSQVHERFNGHP